MKTFKKDTNYYDVALKHAWEQLMGKVIITRTQDLFFRDKKLFLRLSSAPLRKELSLNKSKIIDMLNQQIGEKIVTDIVFI